MGTRSVLALGAVVLALGSVGCAHGRGSAAVFATATRIPTGDGGPPISPKETPAYRYANMDAYPCARELHRRKVPFSYVQHARGVAAPVRLTGPLRGVDFHVLPRSKRSPSPFEILDCRFALTLDDFAVLLAAHDVVEAIHMSMYRPRERGVHHKSQHEAGLAIDLGILVKRDGTRVVIEDEWHGGIGQASCGPDADTPQPPSPLAAELRAIYCAAAERHLFHVMLTPNHDEKHKDHFHLDIVRGAKWFLVK